MIDEITITDLGVIAQASLRPAPGLTVLTGETGAGKTMVLTSIGLLLGRKADPLVVRAGTERAVIEGSFVEPEGGPAHAIVIGAGGLSDDDVLVLSRQVPAEGRSKAYAGGRTVPAGILAEAGTHLVTIHGQADQLLLRSSLAQRDLLDASGDEELHAAKEHYSSCWQAWVSAREELAAAQRSENERERERAEIVAGLELIEQLDTHEGEDDELAAMIERMTNVEDLRRAAATARGLLSGDETGNGSDVVSALAHARSELDRAGDLDPQLAELARALAPLDAVVADVTLTLSDYLADLSADPEALARAHERRAELKRACAPYGGDCATLLAWGTAAAQRLAIIDDPQRSIDQLAQVEEETRNERDRAATRLSEQRRAAAAKLMGAVRTELAGLAMKDSGFTIDVTDTTPGVHGANDIVFGLTDSAGRVRPLGQGASGGELSRLMLALEVSVAGKQDRQGRHTFIFDEVDAGIGGATAVAIGQRLARLASNHQVIVVTHLPQVAAYAERHIVLARGGETTSVTELDEEGRIREIARMLGGDPDSQAARAHAVELIGASRVQ
ncbi:MAG: DNA repair protein RecN [Actinomycetaceae bacterium]|nr:DNA repair protein RecN [Actinomycetaceae bacterium]